MANPADASPPWDVTKEPPRVDNIFTTSGSSKGVPHSFTTTKSGTFVDINRPLSQVLPLHEYEVFHECLHFSISRLIVLCSSVPTSHLSSTFFYTLTVFRPILTHETYFTTTYEWAPSCRTPLESSTKQRSRTRFETRGRIRMFQPSN